MRAYSNNEDLALLSGINPDRVVMVTWIITAVLITLAGTLYGLDKSYKPYTYLSLLLPIFASAIVGGIGSPVGAILGGFVIAFAELFITFAYKRVLGYLLPEQLKPSGLMQLLTTDYKIALSFVILVLVLIIKPTGIAGGKTL
jgi:branched-chain amino acid transport system permease protein